MKITSIDQLKLGDKLRRNNMEEEVVAVCGKLAWVIGNWGVIRSYTCQGLNEAGYTIEEPKWEPKVGDMYYYPYLGDESFAGSTYFVANCNSDLINLKNGLCFQTEEEAIAAAKKMLKALKDE